MSVSIKLTSSIWLIVFDKIDFQLIKSLCKNLIKFLFKISLSPESGSQVFKLKYFKIMRKSNQSLKALDNFILFSV